MASVTTPLLIHPADAHNLRGHGLQGQESLADASTSGGHHIVHSLPVVALAPSARRGYQQHSPSATGAGLRQLDEANPSGQGRMAADRAHTHPRRGRGFRMPWRMGGRAKATADQSFIASEVFQAEARARGSHTGKPGVGEMRLDEGMAVVDVLGGELELQQYSELEGELSSSSMGTQRRFRIRKSLKALARRVWRGMKWLGSKTGPQDVLGSTPGSVRCGTDAGQWYNAHPYLTLAASSPHALPCGSLCEYEFPSEHNERGTYSRKFGQALVGVGSIAGLYHSSWGGMRKVLRKFDYWGIASASYLLRAAAVAPDPRRSTAALSSSRQGQRRLWNVVNMGSLMIIPFKPTLPTAVNFITTQVKCILMIKQNASAALLRRWVVHLSVMAGALVSFAFEDYALPTWLGGKEHA
eukprot:gene18746-25274_t